MRRSISSSPARRPCRRTSTTTSWRKCSSRWRSSTSASMNARPPCWALRRERPMNRNLASLLIFAAALLLFGSSARAQEFDYDPQRPAVLRACDDNRDHGRTTEARTCYEQLLRSQNDLLIQAEAAWALDDVRRANDLFRQAIDNDDKTVRGRVRWGRLYLATHQYSEAGDLFKEALSLNDNDVYAQLSAAKLMSETFDGDARALV